MAHKFAPESTGKKNARLVMRIILLGGMLSLFVYGNWTLFTEGWGAPPSYTKRQGTVLSSYREESCRKSNCFYRNVAKIRYDGQESIEKVYTGELFVKGERVETEGLQYTLGGQGFLSTIVLIIDELGALFLIIWAIVSAFRFAFGED